MSSIKNNIKVGISQRISVIDSYSETRDSLDQKMVEWVLAAGFIPIPIPNTLIDLNLSDKLQPNLEEWLEKLNIEALLLSGGNDIGSAPQRDLTENYLLFWAAKNAIPVLGICRGMQIMATFFDGKLIKVKNHVNVRHEIQPVQLGKYIVPRIVNSYHNYALKECPDEFLVLAVSEDGFIEAIKHKELPWEAWMWHPERDSSFLKIHLENFKELISNGK